MRILIWSCCLFFVSCNGHLLFQERVEISGNSWSYNSPISFTFNISDTTKTYNVLLDIEHSIDFGFQNLYAGIQTFSPTGDTLFNQYSFELADNLGQWLGTCKGIVCSNQVLINKDTRFLTKGTYRMVLNQYSRNVILEGIKSLELTIAAVED